MNRLPCLHSDLWLARDGHWRCAICEPPAFTGEVLDRRPQPGDALPPDITNADRFCAACESPAICADAHYCERLARIDAEFTEQDEEDVPW